MKASELTREYFPDASDEYIDFILWERTPFPCVTSEKEIRKYLQRFKEESSHQQIEER